MVGFCRQRELSVAAIRGKELYHITHNADDKPLQCRYCKSPNKFYLTRVGRRKNKAHVQQIHEERWIREH